MPFRHQRQSPRDRERVTNAQSTKARIFEVVDLLLETVKRMSGPQPTAPSGQFDSPVCVFYDWEYWDLMRCVP